MKCPACRDAILVISDRQGVEIDYCPECRGVWLDRGELDKIIERSTGSRAVNGRPPARGDGGDRYRDSAYADKYRDDHRGDRRRRKKSGAAEFLSEIFDFD